MSDAFTPSVNSEADNGSQKSAKDWPSQLPEHWDLARLKFLCRRSAIYGANIPASEYVSDGVRFLRTTDIDDRGNLTEDDPVFVERGQIEDYLLSDGDVLLSRSGTLGRSFLYRSSRHGECAYAGYLVRFVPGELLNPNFLFFYTKSAGFKVWLARETIESTIGNVSGRKFASLPVPLPPTPEQQNIARFLESRTRRIDDLIAKKERLIELLEEKRTALITQAVTKGLDPDVPMKDSGVEWLGEIPEHWDVTRLSAAVDGCYNGIWGDKPDGEHDVACLRVEDFDRFQATVGTQDPTVRSVEPRYRSQRQLEVGDLLLEKSGGGERQPVGFVVLVNRLDRTSVSSNFAARMPVREGVSPSFLRYVFYHLYQTGVNTRSIKQTTGIQNLDASHYLSTPFALPPTSVQHRIAGYLEEQTDLIHRLILRIREATDRLREYRSALITAAVTGKIDVRNHAA